MQAVEYRIHWRCEESHDIGEGVEEVNSRSFPAWIAMRDDATRNLTVAYAVRKDASGLRKARALVDAAIPSFDWTSPAGQTGEQRPERDR